MIKKNAFPLFFLLNMICAWSAAAENPLRGGFSGSSEGSKFKTATQDTIQPALQNADKSSDDLKVIRIQLPVLWQSTRLRAGSVNPSMVTESYREIWTVEKRPSGLFYLESPRGSAISFPTGSEPSQFPLFWPELMLLPEEEFVRLIGFSDLQQKDTLGDGILGEKFVALAFDPSEDVTNEISLRFPGDQSVEVRISLGAFGLFKEDF